MIGKSQSDFLNLARWVAAALVVVEHVRNLIFIDYGSLESPTVIHKGFYFLTGFGHEAVVIFFGQSKRGHCTLIALLVRCPCPEPHDPLLETFVTTF